MSKYAIDVIKQWAWGFDIEWLNDRGMVDLYGSQVAEIRPVVDGNNICLALEVTVYALRSRAWPSGPSVPMTTTFRFSDYLCDVPRADTRKDHSGLFHLWRCNTSECGWYIAIPETVGPLLLGIERWLDYQQADGKAAKGRV